MGRQHSLVVGTALIVPLLLGGPRSAHADTILAPGGNFSSVAGYTYIKVVNIGPKDETVTVEFLNNQGAQVGSTSSALPPGTAWSVSTAPAVSEPLAVGAVSTGDFDGYICVSSTGSDKKLLVTGMLAFPVDRSAELGGGTVISAVPLVAARAKSCR